MGLKGPIVLSVLLAMLVPYLVNAQTEQGFTVTSVSLTNILHPGQTADQTQWLINIVLNGGGQNIVGTLDNSTINYQGLTSSYPLQISGTTNPERAFYVISNTNPTPIYQFSAQTENGTLGLTFGLVSSYTSAPSCPQTSSSGGTFISERDVEISGLATGHVPTISRVCVYEQIIGYESQVSATPDIESSSTIQLSANNKQELLNINYSQQSATSSDNLVQVNWVGSLVTGNSAPGGNLYVAISNPQQNQWNAQSQSAYSSYTTSFTGVQAQYTSSSTPYTLQTLPSLCSYLGQGANLTSQSPASISTCLLNNIIQPTFATTNQQSQGLLSTSVQIGNSQPTFSQNNGQSTFVITLNNNFVNNQDVTLRVNGSFIGVVIPEGIPKILSAIAPPFNSGNNGTIIVNVQNIGNAQGSFYTTLNNCAGISTTSSPKYSINAGQSQQITIPIYTSSATQVINEECNVSVIDYNGGGSTSTMVNIQSKPANQCQPNTSTVEGDYICPCVSVNGVYQTATGSQCTTCPYGVISNNNGYSCASPPPTVNKSSNTQVDLVSTGVNVVQTIVSASSFVSCTPYVGNILDSILPGITTVANIITSLSGNSC